MTTLPTEILKAAEQAHYRNQVGMYFSGRHEIDGASCFYSDKIEDYYWNYAALVDTSASKLPQLIETIIEFYRAKKRQPAVYVTPWCRPENLADELKKTGFEVQFRDAWMFYQRETPPAVQLPPNCRIKRVETANEMEAIINVFNQAFGGATEDEPYGSLPPSYSEMLRESFKREREDVTVIHYLATVGETPAGLGTLIYASGYAGLYNIGVAPQFRKQGIGAAISAKRITDALDAGNRIIFLQTEKDSSVEAWQRKLGFETQFVGEGFALS